MVSGTLSPGTAPLDNSLNIHIVFMIEAQTPRHKTTEIRKGLPFIFKLNEIQSIEQYSNFTNVERLKIFISFV